MFVVLLCALSPHFLTIVVFTVGEHENICIARLTRRAGYATALIRSNYCIKPD